jgi:hypothetical protein
MVCGAWLVVRLCDIGETPGGVSKALNLPLFTLSVFLAFWGGVLILNTGFFNAKPRRHGEICDRRLTQSGVELCKSGIVNENMIRTS